VTDEKAGYGWAAIMVGLVVATESHPIGRNVHIFNAELIAIQSALLPQMSWLSSQRRITPSGSTSFSSPISAIDHGRDEEEPCFEQFKEVALWQLEGKKFLMEVLHFFERKKIEKLLQANDDWLENHGQQAGKRPSRAPQ